MNLYKPTDEHIWTGRESSKDLYVYQKVKQIDLEIQNIPVTANNSFILLGYECDEGVRRNGGRPGSRLAMWYALGMIWRKRKAYWLKK